MFGVVARPSGVAAGCQCCVEVFRRACFTLPCRYQPCDIFIDPRSTAPSLDLYLEQHLIVNRADPLLRCLVIRKTLSYLGQQRVGDLIQRDIYVREGGARGPRAGSAVSAWPA